MGVVTARQSSQMRQQAMRSSTSNVVLHHRVLNYLSNEPRTMVEKLNMVHESCRCVAIPSSSYGSIRIKWKSAKSHRKEVGDYLIFFSSLKFT